MSRYAQRRGNPEAAYCGDDVAFAWDDEMSPAARARFDQLATPQTRYALEALQHVTARMPWGEVVEFSDGRRGRIEPFYEPRWKKGATGSTELVEGGFDVKFLDGGHLEFQVQQSGWETPVRTANLGTFQVYGDEYPDDGPFARLMAEHLAPPERKYPSSVAKWEAVRDWAAASGAVEDDVAAMLEAMDQGYAYQIAGRPITTVRDVDVVAAQMRLPTSRRPNPQAKLEHRDLLTGQRVRPGTLGSLATGRYVMRIRPGPGEPFEVVEVDAEDLDPSTDTFGVGRETYGRYRKVAETQASARARELKRMPVFEPGAELRLPGTRATFSSADAAAELFLTHNPSLWNMDWADVGDPVEDWMDRIEVRMRGRHRAFDETARGREILDMFRSGRNDRGFRALLVYLFRQAKGRRWENVSWSQIEDLVEIFAENARREADRVGSTTFLSAGIPTITWMPPATGFRSDTPEYLEQLDPRSQEYYRRYEASEHLYRLARELRRLLREGRKCLTSEQRRVVRARTKTLEQWARRPDEMPEWACAVFQEPGVLCGLLGIEEEVSRLGGACEVGYDPDWPRARLEEPLEPGLGVIPAVAAALPAPPEDLDLPWETAANPAMLRERLRRR